jgi:hypothetical protein
MDSVLLDDISSPEDMRLEPENGMRTKRRHCAIVLGFRDRCYVMPVAEGTRYFLLYHESGLGKHDGGVPDRDEEVP